MARQRTRQAREPRSGWPAPAAPIGKVEIRFKPEADIEFVHDAIRRDLSAAALIGRSLFVACDETATVERLTTDDWKLFEGHEPIQLADFFKLPGGPEAEMDIEGLAVDDGYLWIVGSHSLTRDKPKREKSSSSEALQTLKDLDRDSNRFFLGRVPLIEDKNSPGCYGLDSRDAAAKLVEQNSRTIIPDTADATMRTAASLKMSGKGNALTKSMRDDEHLAAFLQIPAKENGFDVEGIAVAGNRVALGLRGPVLRGWACILELHLELAKPGRLKARPIGENGGRYRKHFVDLDGLGIRDLKFAGDDLFILAGPTMDLDGPAAVYRWAGWLRQDGPAVLHPAKTEKLLDLPFGRGAEHPEAIVLWPEGEQPALFVINDCPSEARLGDDANSIAADLFRYPGATSET